jgi:hypothetical protein
MPIGNCKFIQPTGKSVRMPMTTVGVWDNAIMVEEQLFWDDMTYLKQTGVMK